MAKRLPLFAILYFDKCRGEMLDRLGAACERCSCQEPPLRKQQVRAKRMSMDVANVDMRTVTLTVTANDTELLFIYLFLHLKSMTPLESLCLLSFVTLPLSFLKSYSFSNVTPHRHTFFLLSSLSVPIFLIKLDIFFNFLSQPFLFLSFYSIH